MGGSGGGSSGGFSSDPKTIMDRLLSAERSTANAEFDSGVDALLSSLLTNFNDRNHEAIRRHLDEIRRALNKELEGTVDMSFGGSVAKHTYVDGLSDIDSLVMLDNCELADGDPVAAKEYLATRLRERFPNTEVVSGTLAVTVSFQDADVQLLPAVSCRNAVKIASSDGRSWSEIRPREFTSVLTQVNQQNGGKVVPVVKLAKAIIARLPANAQISGYHAESLAVEIFQSYTGRRSPKEMLRHYFEIGAQRALTPIRDRSGQSVHVDDALGPALSGERKAVADAFRRISRKMGNADNAHSLEGWNDLFGT